jgi:hypothetical protein
VWQTAPYSGGTLLTLLALADWADDDGYCFPSIPMIAQKARLGESGAKYTVNRLIAEGALLRVEAGGEGRGHRSRYQISSQYLTPKALLNSPSRTSGKPCGKNRGQYSNRLVGERKGVSTHDRNKEEPSKNHQVNTVSLQNNSCMTCGGTGERASYFIPGRRVRCECQL